MLGLSVGSALISLSVISSLALAQDPTPVAPEPANPASPAANGQLFRPSIDSVHTLWTDDSHRSPFGQVHVRALLHYANRPVVFVEPDGDVTPYVKDVLQLSTQASFSAGPVRLGLDVPVFLRSGGIEGGETGLGDVGLEGRVSVLDGGRKALGVAVIGRTTFPTTTVAASVGSRGLTWELTGVLDKRFGPVLVAVNAGTRGVPEARLDNFEWADHFVGRFGVGWGITDHAGVSLDVGANVPYAGLISASTPAEAIVGGYGRLAGNLVLRGGVGSGLTTGYGAPRYRLVSGLSWEPERRPDADSDGIEDRDDDCVHVPEDLDGYQDLDGCPDATEVRVTLLSDGEPVAGRWSARAVDGGTDAEQGGQTDALVGLAAGEWVIEAFAPGFSDASVAVVVPGGPRHEVTIDVEPLDLPTQLAVRITDDTGTPIQGAWWSMTSGEDVVQQDSTAPVPVQPGRLQVEAHAEGYRTARQTVEVASGDTGTALFVLTPARALVTRERIEVKDSIYFETGLAVIKPESYDLLDEVAEVLVEHDELLRIRIEGHTDSRGDFEYNRQLSADRARAVLDYLVQRGVAEERLQSVGFGEWHPLVEGDGEEAWSINRRVDFFVLDRAD